MITEQPCPVCGCRSKHYNALVIDKQYEEPGSWCRRCRRPCYPDSDRTALGWRGVEPLVSAASQTSTGVDALPDERASHTAAQAGES